MLGKTNRRMSLIAAATTLLAIGIPTGAFATSSPAPDESDISDANAFWVEYGVDTDVREALTEELRDGHRLDANERGSRAVQSDQRTDDGIEFNVSTFEDGSISVAWRQIEPGYVDTAELADPAVRPTVTEEAPSASVAGQVGTMALSTSITGCSVSSGTGYSNYSNCLVGGSVTGAMAMFFYANYSIVAGARNDSISNTVNPGRSYSGIYKGVSLPVLSNYVAKETSAGSAGATYTSTYDLVANSGGTAYLSLAVGGNKATVTFTQV